MELESTHRTSAGAGTCVICGQGARAANHLCSRACLLEARRELDENLATIHQGSDEDRAELIERNAKLTSALISWSP